MERKTHKFDYLDGVTVIDQNQLPKYADGVQLEGGYVYKEKIKPHQRYANVSVVWDLPFCGLEAAEAFAHGKEKFRESRIKAYNEHQVVNLVANLILYYLKTSEAGKKIVFLFYVGKTTSLNLLEAVEKILSKYDPALKIDKDSQSGTKIGCLRDPRGCTMEFFTHYCWFNSKVFENASVVVGFSWNGGFNKSYKSGDIVVPTHFIDIARGKKFSVLFLDKKYKIENDFQTNLASFVKLQDAKLVGIINNEFRSENPAKANHRAHLFTQSDFHQDATLLGTWDIFEPSKWPEDIVIPN